MQELEYQDICDADDKNLSAYVLLLCCEYLETHPEHGAAWCRKGAALVELCRYSEAEEALNKSLEYCPKNKVNVVLSQFGHLEEARGNYAKARLWFMKSHEEDPNDATYLIFVGSTFMKEGNLEKAEKFHSKAITLSDGCIDEAYFNLGGVYLAQERYNEAKDCYLKALEIDPEYKNAKEWLYDVECVIKNRC